MSTRRHSLLSRISSSDGARALGVFFRGPVGARLGRPISLVALVGVSDGKTELRKATGFWMGLGVELLDVGDAA